MSRFDIETCWIYYANMTYLNEIYTNLSDFFPGCPVTPNITDYFSPT